MELEEKAEELDLVLRSSCDFWPLYSRCIFLTGLDSPPLRSLVLLYWIARHRFLVCLWTSEEFGCGRKNDMADLHHHAFWRQSISRYQNSHSYICGRNADVVDHSLCQRFCRCNWYKCSFVWRGDGNLHQEYTFHF